jgi:HEAT repeat protein
MKSCLLMLAIFFCSSIPAWAGVDQEDAPVVPCLTMGSCAWGGDADLKVELAFALGSIGESALPELAQGLQSKEHVTRGLMAAAVATAGPAAKPYLPQVIAELMAQPGVQGENEYSAVYPIAYGLGQCGGDAVLLLEAELAKEGETARRAMLAIGNAGPAAAPAVDALIKLLSSSNPQLRLAAADTLAQLGPAAEPAVEALIKLLNDQDSDVCQRAAFTLGALKLKPELAVPALIAALKKDPENQIWWCSQALGEFRAAAQPAMPLFIELLSKSTTCQDAELVLVNIGAAAVPAFISALANKDPDVRYYAVTGLGSIGAAAAEAIPALLSALADPSAEVRWNAAQCLGAIGQQPEMVVPALQALLGDKDADVRYCAALALGRYKNAALDAKADLVQLLADPDSTVRWGAAGAIIGLGPAATVDAEDELLSALQTATEDPSTKGRIIAALILSGKDSERIAALVIQALHEEYIGTAVVESLGELGANGVQALIRMLAVNDTSSRLYAAAKLAELGPEAKPALTALQEALAQEDGLCAVVLAHAVIKTGGTASVILPTIARGLVGADPQARWYAAYAVEDAGISGPGIVDGLRYMLQVGSWDEQLVAAHAIQSLGPLAEAAVPELMNSFSRAVSSENEQR